MAAAQLLAACCCCCRLPAAAAAAVPSAAAAAAVCFLGFLPAWYCFSQHAISRSATKHANILTRSMAVQHTRGPCCFHKSIITNLCATPSLQSLVYILISRTTSQDVPGPAHAGQLGTAARPGGGRQALCTSSSRLQPGAPSNPLNPTRKRSLRSVTSAPPFKNDTTPTHHLLNFSGSAHHAAAACTQAGMHVYYIMCL